MEKPKYTIKLQIDSKKTLNRLIRKVDKAIYYNDNCICKLQSSEMITIDRVLTALYEDYILHKDDEEYSGIKHCILAEKIGMSKIALKATIWMLIPQFVDIRTYGRDLKIARKYKLNGNGIELVERIMNPDIKNEVEEVINIDDIEDLSEQEEVIEDDKI